MTWELGTPLVFGVGMVGKLCTINVVSRNVAKFLVMMCYSQHYQFVYLPSYIDMTKYIRMRNTQNIHFHITVLNFLRTPSKISISHYSHVFVFLILPIWILYINGLSLGMFSQNCNDAKIHNYNVYQVINAFKVIRCLRTTSLAQQWQSSSVKVLIIDW